MDEPAIQESASPRPEFDAPEVSQELSAGEAAANAAQHTALIHAARLQARHRQANRAQDAVRTDAIPGYTVQRELHRGGQGVVYLATDDGTGDDVALKVIRDGPTARPNERTRFEREIQVLERLSHPGVVRIRDHGRVGGSRFYVMDFIAGSPLVDHAQRGELSPSGIAAIVADACDAVAVAHAEGVIHRDLKPSNILVDADGRPHVLDFGLAKLSDEMSAHAAATETTRTGQFVGSLPYASPEQAGGETDALDERTDIYSMGVVLYQALTGSFPYSVEGSLAKVVHQITTVDPVLPRSHREDITPALERVVLWALAKDPAQRPRSIAAWADAIRAAVSDTGVEDHKVPSIGAPARGTTRTTDRRARRATIVAGVSFAVAGTSVGLMVRMTIEHARHTDALQTQIDELAARVAMQAEAPSDASAIGVPGEGESPGDEPIPDAP